MSPRIRIVHLSPETLAALADGDAARAVATSPVPLNDYLIGPDCRDIWTRRANQVVETPEDLAWVTGVLWDEDAQIAVGRAGYHGAPDPEGMVEVGYGIDPGFRRRGYARAALVALIERARLEPTVHTLRATISPDNEPSLALIHQFDFVENGEQWDEEDGLEIIYEIPV
jgi:ribosomal-protein-alanine N-acetyltransferase